MGVTPEGLAWAEAALGRARVGSGATAFCFLHGEESLTWDLQEPSTGRALESRGGSVRAVIQWFEGGRVGVAEGPVSGPRSLDDLFSEARTRHSDGPMQSVPSLENRAEVRASPSLGSLSGDRARAWSSQVVERVGAGPGRFQTVLVRQSLGWMALVSSTGARATEWRPSTQLWVRYETGRGAVVEAIAAPDLTGALDVEPLCSRLIGARSVLAEEGAPPDVSLPCVLGPSVAAPLVMGLGQLLRGDLAARSAGLARAVGRKLFPSVVSVRDLPARSMSSTRREVDDEGTPMQPVTLVEDGRLTGFLHTRETAAALGVPNEGRALWMPGTARCVPAAVGLHVSPGTWVPPPRYNEMSVRLETFSVLPRGGLAALIAAGWEVRDGQRVRRIGPVDLDLPVLETLRRVSSVGEDLQFFPALEGCGTPSLYFDSWVRKPS
ncbi:metallopeptidase TldD-related protein [Myxococcaceae bacterium GXIMD 01537]